MTPAQLKALQPGDLVRNKGSASAYVIHSNYGDHCTAVRTVDVSNPSEWDVVRPDGSVIMDPSWTDGYYWMKCERASERAIVQRVNGEWFAVNEKGPISMAELNQRGWFLDESVR